ncbi:hypothetical protein GE107_07280 [Cohnella sp. CFH 77786]|uniref:DUF7210 family protein n=1 Tax=Cohnella sp. CFH 77786 TaxID=2662265 RepID=UPI001C60F306|nr:hypothetical protein [Cohnella sp. CFH 77786]MBW5445861.1 hypothetical protein [Cohnella sp. CFH 77786]
MADKEKQTTASYKALRQLRHNDEKVKPGQTVELTEAEAERLLDLGAIEALEKPKSGGKNSGSGGKTKEGTDDPKDGENDPPKE